MADNLKRLEKRLNTDEDLRNKFIKNPARFLRAEGISVTPAQSSEIKAEITKLKLPRPEAVQRRRIRIIIKISVGIGKTSRRS